MRTGGIYALERVALDSTRDQYTVMEVLAAFVRDHSRKQPPRPEPGANAVPLRTTHLDLQAAVTVIGRRNSAITQRIDLTGADLSGAILIGGVRQLNGGPRSAGIPPCTRCSCTRSRKPPGTPGTRTSSGNPSTAASACARASATYPSRPAPPPGNSTTTSWTRSRSPCARTPHQASGRSQPRA